MTGEEVWIRFLMTTHCIIHTTLSSERGARKPGPCQDLNQGRTFPVLSVHCTLVGCIRVCFPQWTTNFSKDMEVPLSSLLFLFICNNLSTCPSTSPGRPPLWEDWTGSSGSTPKNTLRRDTLQAPPAILMLPPSDRKLPEGRTLFS